MNNETLTRQQLYELVWSKPLTKIAEIYGLSDNGVRKICIRMKIPLPKRGHWAKVKYGYKVKAVKLPKNYTGENEVTFNTEQVEKFMSGVSPLQTLKKEIENTPGLPITVPEKLSKPDALIIAAKKAFTERRKDKWFRRNEVQCISNSHLDIRVAPNMNKRALLFMDTLIKLLKARGHKVEIKYQNTYIVIFGEELKLILREKSKKITVDKSNSWPSTQLVPIGKFSLTIDNYYTRQWNDGIVPIENRLPEILAKIEILGKKLHQETLEREKRRKIREEEERIEKERLARIQKEKDDVKAFIKEANRWQHAQFLRSYIKSLEEHAKINNTINKELIEYIQWANNKINWYDPLIDAEDTYLVDEDKDELLKDEDKTETPQRYYYW